MWFSTKPLGLGLVPSTQLYGTWEVSTIAPPTPASPSVSSPVSSQHPHDDQVRERQKIVHGDVIIAVNYSKRIARLPGGKFAVYLRKTACPIVVTLRRPSVYGSLASRAVSTAMFPTSYEYRGRGHDANAKKFHGRAPSVQWKRSLQHELSKKKTKQLHVKRVVYKIPDELSADTDPRPSSSLLSSVSQSIAELSPMGEYTHEFTKLPLHLHLAPSTRAYGSVEVYDPKQYAPRVQIGDVVMAVNGDTSVAQWPTDHAISHVTQHHVPMTITFRRPAAYRRYLEDHFKTTAPKLSSQSTTTAMFPDSAEYKHGMSKAKKAKQSSVNTAPHHRRGSFSSKPNRTTTQNRVASPPKAPIDKEEWQHFSRELAVSDQFKLWQSGKAKATKSKGKKTDKSTFANVAALTLETSAFLTERHVHYLWSHLPEYLTCNDMELVYDTRRHGWNVLSFYSHVMDKGPTLLVVKDTRDQIFGCFSSSSWKQSADVYGNGRCFVFTLRPQMKVYTWSGLENTFMYGRHDAIMMGGGKKGMALCLQLDELRGFSKACDTFDSPPLVHGDSGDFEMESMEVWCFSGLRI